MEAVWIDATTFNMSSRHQFIYKTEKVTVGVMRSLLPFVLLWCSYAEGAGKMYVTKRGGI